MNMDSEIWNMMMALEMINWKNITDKMMSSKVCIYYGTPCNYSMSGYWHEWLSIT